MTSFTISQLFERLIGTWLHLDDQKMNQLLCIATYCLSHEIRKITTLNDLEYFLNAYQ